MTVRSILMLTALAAVVPAAAQTPNAGPPGTADVSRILAGSYKVDNNHTQVVWTVDHLGISPLSGAFGASGGSLEIDPAKPSAAKVSVSFKIAEISTTSSGFTTHLLNADLFEAAKYPTGTFVSTAVEVNGTSARVTGNLTLKGVTKPITLAMKFYGAGANPMSKKLQVGFSGTTTIKRSEYGLGYSVPRVADNVRLDITGVFEKVG